MSEKSSFPVALILVVVLGAATITGYRALSADVADNREQIELLRADILELGSQMATSKKNPQAELTPSKSAMVTTVGWVSWRLPRAAGDSKPANDYLMSIGGSFDRAFKDVYGERKLEEGRALVAVVQIGVGGIEGVELLKAPAKANDAKALVEALRQVKATPPPTGIQEALSEPVQFQLEAR